MDCAPVTASNLHEIRWGHEQAEEPAGHTHYCRLASLAELPGWIDEIERA